MAGFDDRLQMYHVRHRVYDPVPGPAGMRWLQRDPAFFVDGLNLYAYCGGDPVNYLDPMGKVGVKSWTEALGYRGYKAYVEVCAVNGGWAELKVMKASGKEITRWRWDRATGVIQEVLRHGGRSLPGLTRAASVACDDAIGAAMLRAVGHAEQIAGRKAAEAAAIRSTASRGAGLGSMVLMVVSVLDMFASEARAEEIPRCEYIEIEGDALVELIDFVIPTEPETSPMPSP